MPRFYAVLLLALVGLFSAPSTSAQEAEVRRVVLTNGDVYVGTIEDESADPLVIVTQDGVRREFAQSRIAEVGGLIRGRFFRTDPVTTRLFIAPTARTLGAGEFRGDLAYVYPSITAGLSGRVDLLGSGFASIGQDAFVSPLVGVKGLVYDGATAKVALGTSVLFAIGSGDDGFIAVPYAVATFGDETRAVTVGVGGAVGGSIGTGDVEVANGAVFGLGAERQINNGVKLFVESFVGASDGEAGLLVLPGVRFFGTDFAFDVIGFVATDFNELVGFAPIGARVSYSF